MSEVLNESVCSECGGFCCNFFFRVLEQNEITPKTEEYFDAVSRGKRYLEDGRIVYVIQSKCKYSGESECELGDKRPSMCKEFPAGEHEIWELFCPLMKKIKGEQK